jgi:hypothetical protein
MLVALAGLFALICLFGIGIAACSYGDAHTQQRFDNVFVGATKEAVIVAMGMPSHVETPDALYEHNYAGRKCEGACVERLWYEHRLCLDEAWVFDLDKKHMVISKDHISSP